MSDQEEQQPHPGAGGSGGVELNPAGVAPGPVMTITASGGLTLPSIGVSNG